MRSKRVPVFIHVSLLRRPVTLALLFPVFCQVAHRTRLQDCIMGENNTCGTSVKLYYTHCTTNLMKTDEEQRMTELSVCVLNWVFWAYKLSVQNTSPVHIRVTRPCFTLMSENVFLLVATFQSCMDGASIKGSHTHPKTNAMTSYI